MNASLIIQYNTMSTCVLFICNADYFPKFIQTYTQLRKEGNYIGDVCLIICDDLFGSEMVSNFVKNEKILVKHFPFIQFPNSFYESQTAIERPNHWNLKLFQFNKLYLFHPFLQQWDYVLYLDCGIHIFGDIEPILRCAEPGVLYAHSNTYPYHEHTLKDEFWNASSLFEEMKTQFHLDVDYPQTTMMLYDTSLTGLDVYMDLYKLCLKYPIAMTNDQSIIALYFTNIRPVWKQIPLEDERTCYYDYLKRATKQKPYIMVKVAHIRDNNKKIEYI